MENVNKTSKREVFCRYIRKNGRIIYPRNAKYFHFWVDDTVADKGNPNQISLFDNGDAD